MIHEPRNAADAARLAEILEEAVHDHIEERVGQCPETDDDAACTSVDRSIIRALALAGFTIVRAEGSGDRWEREVEG